MRLEAEGILTIQIFVKDSMFCCDVYSHKNETLWCQLKAYLVFTFENAFYTHHPSNNA